MAFEANVLAEQQDAALLPPERRERRERRGKDRRKSGSRINASAPTQSTLRRIGLMWVGVITALIAITIVASEVTGVGVPFEVITLETAAWAVALIVVALGFIEQRLTEIRLELMMLNGGRRQGDDRRRSDRRA